MMATTGFMWPPPIRAVLLFDRHAVSRNTETTPGDSPERSCCANALRFL